MRASPAPMKAATAGPFRIAPTRPADQTIKDLCLTGRAYRGLDANPATARILIAECAHKSTSALKARLSAATAKTGIFRSVISPAKKSTTEKKTSLSGQTYALPMRKMETKMKIAWRHLIVFVTLVFVFWGSCSYAGENQVIFKCYTTQGTAALVGEFIGDMCWGPDCKCGACRVDPLWNPAMKCNDTFPSCSDACRACWSEGGFPGSPTAYRCIDKNGNFTNF